MRIIEAEGISKHYGEGEALVKSVDQVSLSIQAHRITAIVGKSGSGKTTLLHILGGLEPPDAGTVRVLGRSLYELPDSRRTRFRREHIGFIFQKFQLIPELTVRQNIRLPLEVAGKKVDRELEAELLSLLDLEDRVDFYPHQLSGGGQQRTAIARALLVKPELVLADEPTGNIDQEAGAALLEFIRESHRRFGQTFVVVTHDPEVAAMAHRRILIRDGRVSEEIFQENCSGEGGGEQPEAAQGLPWKFSAEGRAEL